MTTLTISLEDLSTERAEMLAGLLLTFAKANESGFTDPTVPLIPAPPAIDPSAAFGTAPAGKISDVAPSVEIPNFSYAPTVVHPSQNGANTSIAQTAPISADTSLDKEGLPWDGRIHSSSHAMNADGTWRKKKGLAKDHLDKVVAELRSVMSIPSPGPQLVVNAPPPPAQSAAAPPPPPAQGEATRDEYIALFNRVSAALNTGKLTHEQLQKCLDSIGIPSLPLLAPRLDLVPRAAALIAGVIAGVSA